MEITRRQLNILKAYNKSTRDVQKASLKILILLGFVVYSLACEIGVIINDGE